MSIHSQLIACECAAQASQLTAIQDGAQRIATWIGHQGLHRNPFAKFHRSRHCEIGHHSAVLLSQHCFYTRAAGLEACDWPSHSVTVQLNAEKAVGTSQIENNRENGPKWGKNGVKYNKGERK